MLSILLLEVIKAMEAIAIHLMIKLLITLNCIREQIFLLIVIWIGDLLRLKFTQITIVNVIVRTLANGIASLLLLVP